MLVDLLGEEEEGGIMESSGALKTVVQSLRTLQDIEGQFHLNLLKRNRTQLALKNLLRKKRHFSGDFRIIARKVFLS